MRGNHDVVQRMVDRFAPDIFECEDEADVDRLLTFQRATFGKDARQAKPRFTRWAYMNLYGSKLSYCERNGDVVGQQGRLQTTLHIAGKDVPAVWATDLRVRDDWKMKGLGVALIGNVLRHNRVVMAVGVSEEARTMFHRQGWIVLGRIDALLKPLTPKGFRRSDIRSTRGNIVLGHVLSWLCRPMDRVLTAVVRFRHRNVRIVPVERFDDSFDALLQWRRTHCRVCCERSTSFLNWRFVDCPVAARYQTFALWTGECLRGFVVLRRGDRFGKDVMYIDELIVEQEFLPRMIGFVVEQSYKVGVDAVYYEGLGKSKSTALRKWAFFRRGSGHFFVVHARDEELGPELSQRENWSLTIADSDMGFRHDR